MNLTNKERETVITFNEADKTADVFTYNRKLLGQLSQLASDRPDECKVIYDNPEGAVCYEVPKKWIKVRASRILSDEQRQAIADRLSQNRN